MYAGQKEKLARYLRNAEPFLWGVIPGNKKAVLAALGTNLEELGEDSIPLAENKKPTYTMLTDSLLAKLRIEKVIIEIVARQVRREFADRPGALDFLRAHWLSGTLPRWQTLQTLRAPRTVQAAVGLNTEIRKAFKNDETDGSLHRRHMGFIEADRQLPQGIDLIGDVLDARKLSRF